MNKIKALFISVCLLSISSVGYASTVSMTGTSAGSTGTVTLDSAPANFFGGFTGASVIYDLFSTTNSIFSIDAVSSKAGVGLSDLEIALYSENGAAVNFQPSPLMNQDTFIGSDSTLFANITALLATGVHYYLQLTGLDTYSYNVTISEVSAVPVPAAGLLFASALFGAGALGRRKKKTADTSVVGAFARAS